METISISPAQNSPNELMSSSPYTNQVAEPLEIIHIMQSRNGLPMSAGSTVIAGP